MHINVSIPDKISRAKKQDHSIDQLVNATVSMSSSMEQSNRRTNVDNASGKLDQKVTAGEIKQLGKDIFCFSFL
ncbi:hypothetical protein JHK87_049865 [Glycine soja]|nr:hypothetical protein JHK87_049865 [Glycine soja]